MSADEITTYWSNNNNTDINPIISQLPNINTSDGSTVERRVWENGDNCVRVEELKVIGGDHDWPGTWGNMDISASVEIWNFVSKFDINGLIDCNTTSNQEINNFHNKKTLAITDMLGRNTKVLKNIPLFYIYDDGTVEKRIIIE
jgi:polyhydroxybutyrate depolymerase